MDVHLPKCGIFFGWWPSPPAGSQRGHNLTSLTHESATNGSLPAAFLVSKATTQTLSKPVILTYFDSTHGLGLYWWPLPQLLCYHGWETLILAPTGSPCFSAPPAAPLGEDRQSAWGLPSWDDVHSKKVLSYVWPISQLKSTISKWHLKLTGLSQKFVIFVQNLGVFFSSISLVPIGSGDGSRDAESAPSLGPWKVGNLWDLQRWSGSLQQSHESSGHSHLRQTWNQG